MVRLGDNRERLELLPGELYISNDDMGAITIKFTTKI